MERLFELAQRCMRSARVATLLPLALMVLLAACDSVEERLENHYQRGLALLEDAAPDKAILEFRNALKLNEDHVPSHFELGKIQEAKGNIRPAFRLFTTVVNLEPNHVAARKKTTRYFLLVGQVEDAEEELEAALRFAPDDAEVHALEGAIALKKGRSAA